MIEKLLTGFALSATAHQHLSGAREGCAKQYGSEGREMVQLSSVVHPQTQPPPHTELLLSPLLCPAVCGQVPQNPYRASIYVTLWKVFEEEKTPACLPGCLFPTMYWKPIYKCHKVWIRENKKQNSSVWQNLVTMWKLHTVQCHCVTLNLLFQKTLLDA